MTVQEYTNYYRRNRSLRKELKGIETESVRE